MMMIAIFDGLEFRLLIIVCYYDNNVNVIAMIVITDNLWQKYNENDYYGTSSDGSKCQWGW